MKDFYKIKQLFDMLEIKNYFFSGSSVLEALGEYSTSSDVDIFFNDFTSFNDALKKIKSIPNKKIKIISKELFEFSILELDKKLQCIGFRNGTTEEIVSTFDITPPQVYIDPKDMSVHDVGEYLKTKELKINQINGTTLPRTLKYFNLLTNLKSDKSKILLSLIETMIDKKVLKQVNMYKIEKEIESLDVILQNLITIFSTSTDKEFIYSICSLLDKSNGEEYITLHPCGHFNPDTPELALCYKSSLLCLWLFPSLISKQGATLISFEGESFTEKLTPLEQRIVS